MSIAPPRLHHHSNRRSNFMTPTRNENGGESEIDYECRDRPTEQPLVCQTSLRHNDRDSVDQGLHWHWQSQPITPVTHKSEFESPTMTTPRDLIGLLHFFETGTPTPPPSANYYYAVVEEAITNLDDNLRTPTETEAPRRNRNGTGNEDDLLLIKASDAFSLSPNQSANSTFSSSSISSVASSSSSSSSFASSFSLCGVLSSSPSPDLSLSPCLDSVVNIVAASVSGSSSSSLAAVPLSAAVSFPVADVAVNVNVIDSGPSANASSESGANVHYADGR